MGVILEEEKELIRKLKKEFREKRGCERRKENNEIEKFQLHESYIDPIDCTGSNAVMFGWCSGGSCNMSTEGVYSDLKLPLINFSG